LLLLSCVKETFHSLAGTRYAVGRVFARGGFADLHEGWDRIAGRAVAIKIPRADIDPLATPRLLREGGAGASVAHPNVCRTMAYGELPDGNAYLVLERLVGRTMRQVLKVAERLPPPEAVAIVRDLLRGLAAVHTAGIIHCDVKPDNVMVGRTIKLIDFGLCLPSPDAPPLTRQGWILGTPEYMAPEQAEGKGGFDPRIDLYAAGVVLHEALTGVRRPTESRERCFARVDLSDARIPEGLRGVLATALADDPAERYASAEAFEDALAAAQRASTSSIVVPRLDDRGDAAEVRYCCA
jgi:serine/threonine-protein kinase